MPRFSLSGVCAGVIASVLCAGVAHAEGSAADKAAAEALFDEAKKLLAEKKFPEACKRLEDSQKLDPGIGTLLFLADCYEKVGRTASAWATFREAASTAKSSGQGQREQVARKRADLLEPQLARLVVQVSQVTAAVEGLIVKRDDAEVSRSLWGSGTPVDPGEHVISVTAPKKKPWSTKVTIESAPKELTVVVPELEDDAVAPIAAPPPAPPEPAPAPVAPPPAPVNLSPESDRREDSGSGQRTLGIVLGGVGMVGVVVGSIFGLKASSKNSDADTHCPNKCDPEGVSLGGEAKDAATISTIAFAAGGVVLATGIVVYAMAPAAKEPSAIGGRWRVAATAHPQGGVVSLGRSW